MRRPLTYDNHPIPSRPRSYLIIYWWFQKDCWKLSGWAGNMTLGRGRGGTGLGKPWNSVVFFRALPFFSKFTVFLTLWILKLLLKEHDLFFLADLSNALELGYYIISDVCRFLPFQSYFQLWKSKHKKDTLEVQRQSFSSCSFGLWKVTALWRHFTRCQEIQFFDNFLKQFPKI